MADEPEDFTLRYLRKLDAKLDTVLTEVWELKTRQSETHGAVLSVKRDILSDAE